jgi:hypothetical protein
MKKAEKRLYPASAVEDFMADLGGGTAGYDDGGDEEAEAQWVVKEGRCARCGVALRAMGRCRCDH